MSDFTPLPLQPHDEDGPVFDEPWQAEAFALAVQLSESGLFTWKEWTETIGDEMQKARDGGDPDLGDTYYDHWLRALERLVTEKGAAERQPSSRLLLLSVSIPRYIQRIGMSKGEERPLATSAAMSRHTQACL
jgi:nitrile hydratase accessory protein